MLTLLLAFIGGMLVSIPAFAMFNEVGASPFRNLETVQQLGGSITDIILYFALIWLLPPVGAVIGAKIGGRSAGLHYMYRRAVGGQILFSIGFSLLLTLVGSAWMSVSGMPTRMQTLAFLAVAQIGCTLGVVWRS